MKVSTGITHLANAKIAKLYADGLVEYLQERGVDPGKLLERIDINRESVETSLPGWVRLLDTATQFLNQPELPALAGVSLQPRHLGALGQVLMSCSDLKEAYGQLARYIRLLGQIGQPELIEDGNEARLLWHWPFDSSPPQSVALFMLAARVRFMRWLSDRPGLKVNAMIHGQPIGDISVFKKVFGGTVIFNAPQSQLIFPADQLRLKVVTAGLATKRDAEALAINHLARLSKEDHLVDQIKLILTTRMASGNLALSETAAALHLSTRTLQRKLNSENISYRQLLNEAREAQAQMLLKDPHLPLAEIAFLLGYRDQSTFNNAYRRWLKISPGQWRQIKSRTIHNNDS